MRLVTFRIRGVDAPRIGARVSRQVLDFAAAAGVAGEAPPPSRMRDLLAAGKTAMKQARKLYEQAKADRNGFAAALLDEREIRFLPPLAEPVLQVHDQENRRPVDGDRADDDGTNKTHGCSPNL